MPLPDWSLSVHTLRLICHLLSHLTFEVLESVPSIVIARVNELASSTLLPVVNVFYEKQNLRLREVLAVRLERITMVLE